MDKYILHFKTYSIILIIKIIFIIFILIREFYYLYNFLNEIKTETKKLMVLMNNCNY